MCFSAIFVQFLVLSIVYCLAVIMCFSAIFVCATCQVYDTYIYAKIKRGNGYLLSVFYSNLLKYVHLII